ncbi:MAG: signal peptide peptidase SppA [Candidatus Eisenbacteria bacterium]|nr:signal peptide peptidase SppA [Candidatus Eisenbacteria bacterium]
MVRRGCIWGWLIGAVTLIVIFLVTIVTIEAVLGQRLSFPAYGERVGLVRIEGILADSRDIVSDLRTMGEDAGIRAVVLRVDSPGGGVAASQEIYDEVVRLRDGGTPVVVSMGSVAASGGYYVACAADSIIANAGTITGSIGVIMEFAHFEELFGKIGIGFDTVKSGEFKDIGSLSRQLTERERELLQLTIDDIHAQFVDAVALERGMTADDVLRIADGRILSGRQALEAGLVDRLGSLRDAIAVAGRLGGIKGRPKVQEPARPMRLALRDLLSGSLSRALQPSASSYGAQYLYKPAK